MGALVRLCALVVLSAALAKADFTNPILNTNTPQPGVNDFGGSYVMASSLDTGSNAIPLQASPDLLSWKTEGFALPGWKAAKNPAWATGGFSSPELHYFNKQYVLYFAAKHSSGRTCIGVATRTGTAGTFRDIGSPLYLNTSVDVSDPTVLKLFDSRLVIIWKAATSPVTFVAQYLSNDGLSMNGTAPLHELLRADADWEAGSIAAPWILQKDQFFFLFYSGNVASSPSYATGVARADSVFGPYTKYTSRVLSSSDSWVAPGEGSILRCVGHSDRFVIVYNAWAAGAVGGSHPRELLMDRLFFSRHDWPQVLNSAPSDREMRSPCDVPPPDYDEDTTAIWTILTVVFSLMVGVLVVRWLYQRRRPASQLNYSTFEDHPTASERNLGQFS